MLPQNWPFDRKEIRKYLNRVRSFFQARDKLLRHLNWELHVTLDEVAKEMNGALKDDHTFMLTGAKTSQSAVCSSWTR